MSSSNLVDIFLLSLFAMFNPSLLAATTLMLLLRNGEHDPQSGKSTAVLGL